MTLLTNGQYIMHYILFYLNQLQENCHILGKKICINIHMRNHHISGLNSQNRLLRAEHSPSKEHCLPVQGCAQDPQSTNRLPQSSLGENYYCGASFSHLQNEPFFSTLVHIRIIINLKFAFSGLLYLSLKISTGLTGHWVYMCRSDL